MIVPELGALSRKDLEKKLEDLRSTGVPSEELVDVMFELDARETFGGNLSFKFEDEIRTYTEELDYGRGRCWVVTQKAAASFLRSDLTAALEGFSRAKSIAAELKEHAVERFLLVAIGDVHKSFGNYETNIRYMLDALQTIDEYDDPLVEGWLYQGLSACSNDLGDHVRALEYAEKGKQVFGDLVEHHDEPQALAGLARCMTETGVAFHKLGRLEDGEQEHQDALGYYRRADNRIGIARAMNDLGRLAQERSRFDEAEELHRESLKIRREIRNTQSQATSLLNLGELYVSRGDLDEGIACLHDALAICTETGARLRKFQVHAALASAFERKGDFESALNHHREFHRIKEQVSNDSLNGRIADLQMRSEIDAAEKEAEIERLKNVELKRTLDELKTAQDRLVHAEKMASLGAMTAGIAHEIKNPLNFVNNFAAMSIELAGELEQSLAQDGAVDSDATEILIDVRENAERILEHGRRADRIVKNMLLHAGGNTAEHARFDLNSLVEEYVGLAYHGARATDSTFNVAIEQHLDEGLPEVVGVPQEIGRVVLNLVVNAFDALRKERHNDAKIVVTTEEKGSWIVVSVSDNGSGIPEDIRGRIFEPFFTTKPAGDGTGLGLSLSYDIIVQGHGGELELEDRQGWTTFVIRLPL